MSALWLTPAQISLFPQDRDQKAYELATVYLILTYWVYETQVGLAKLAGTGNMQCQTSGGQYVPFPPDAQGSVEQCPQ